MTQQEKVAQMASLVEERLLPLIDHDYVLYGVPNYSNVGDLLIWEGDIEFLKKVPFKCKGVCAWNEYPTEPAARDNIILVHGGGYFGDVWRKAWEHCLSGIRFFKDNKVIILPMSIYYGDSSLRDTDAAFFAEFKNLIICARDDYSYQLARTYFHNEVVLVPDMAWCVKRSYLERWVQPSSERVLLLKRIDKELGIVSIDIPETIVDIHDWPTIESMTIMESLYNKLIKLIKKCQRRLTWMTPLFKRLKDGMNYWFYRKQMISRGVSFLSSYDKIYTTRLHALILSVFLGKDVYIIDNSYGKLSASYNTWLKDVDHVHLFAMKDTDDQ